MFKTMPDIFSKTLVVGLLAIVMLILAACNEQLAGPTRHYAVDRTEVAAAFSELETQSDAAGLEVESLGVFSSGEMTMLLQVYRELREMREIVQDLPLLSGESQQFMLDSGQLQFLYQMGVLSYAQARGVMQTHWDELPPDVQKKLKQSDRLTQRLHEAMSAILIQPVQSDMTAVVRDALLSGAEAAKILQMAGVP